MLHKHRGLGNHTTESIEIFLVMCFGNGTKHKVEVRRRSRHESRGSLCLGGGHRRIRYGPTQTYYPSHYYARPPTGLFWPNHHHQVHHRSHSHGHFGQHHHHNHHQHAAVVPSRQVLVPTGADYGHRAYHAGGRAIMPPNAAMVSGRSFRFASLRRLSASTPPAPSSAE